MPGIEIDYGSLHTQHASQPEFEAGTAKMFDECGQVVGCVQRKPFNGLARFSSHRSERAPLVNGQTRIGCKFLSIAAQGNGR